MVSPNMMQSRYGMNKSRTKISSIMCNRAGKALARVLATTPRRGWKSLHGTVQCVMLVPTLKQQEGYHTSPLLQPAKDKLY